MGLYLLPLVLLLATCWITGAHPWEHGPAKPVLTFLGVFLTNLSTWGLPVLTLALGVVEFFFGLYDRRWTWNEKILDAVCFVAAKVVIRPLMVYFTLLALPRLFPGQKGVFSWVPFWWGFFIIAVADDLTQYWYHRLHHQVPFMWRFHRTHHSAQYMGMSMAGRQNIIYTIFFSQLYLTAALNYLGLGESALLVGGVKSLITLAAHSSIPWDRPFYKYRALHPAAWVLERLISTPATHHAHHADSDDDGNMFFLWDVLFGTGIITRQYPASFGLQHYKQEEWYAQFLWPIFKSRKEGSELARGGPMVGDFPFAAADVAGFGAEAGTGARRGPAGVAAGAAGAEIPVGGVRGTVVVGRASIDVKGGV